jgi:hypothetical protein
MTGRVPGGAACAHGPLDGADRHRPETLRLAPEVIGTLALQRHFFQSFCQPHSQSWMHGAVIAAERFGDLDGPRVWYAVLAQVQAMRRARPSVFVFANPLCPHCRQTLTEDERHLALALQDIRQGRAAWARAHALCLTEGADCDGFLQATTRLAAVLPTPRPVLVH